MILLLLAILFSLLLGRYPLSPGELIGALRGSGPADAGAPAAIRTALVRSVLLDSRLPRIAGAVLIGAALSVSGGAYQAVFRNPLVSPGLLGVLRGAGFGAALAIVLGWPPAAVQAAAFGGGIGAVGCGVAVARAFGENSIVMLVFGGLLSSALFTALLGILKYVADPDDQLPAITFWLLGSLAPVTPRELWWLAGPLVLGIAALAGTGRLLDALAMGDDEARTLGVPADVVRLGVIGLATAIAALTVSLAGMIGWVGLIVPHAARLLVGPGNTRLLPLSACLGGMFLLAADDLARSLFVAEIPIGIVTQLVGVAGFLLLLPRARRGWT